MLKKIFKYLFSSLLDEFRDEVRDAFQDELASCCNAQHEDTEQQVTALRQELAVPESALGKALVDLTSEQIVSIRRDMALEMNRVGLALMATNHQVMILKSDMNIVKTTHNQILEVARKLTETAPAPEKRTPGQVDWIPSPSHFGNKIEMMP